MYPIHRKSKLTLKSLVPRSSPKSSLKSLLVDARFLIILKHRSSVGQIMIFRSILTHEYFTSNIVYCFGSNK